MDERDYSGADMDIDSEMFDEDEMDNVAQLNANDVIQPMLLFKLKFQNDNLNSISNVRAMIDEYNFKIKEERERYIREFRGTDVEVYKQTKVTKRTTSLYHGNSSTDSKITNFITIYYTADGNIYAQTTGNAWHVVTKYGDIKFPVKISQRLLDDKGMKTQTRIPLSGNTIFQQKRSKKPERSYDTGTQNVLARFGADLRMNASIRQPNLNCFTRSDKKILVKVGFKFVQFDCNIKKDGMKNFIDHLNKICNGMQTTTTDGLLESDTDAFDEQLRKADENEKKSLDEELKMRLESYIQRKENFVDHLSDLDLCQQDIFPFSYGHNFTIRINKRNVELSQTPPTLEMALNKIRENVPTTTLNGRRINGNDTGRINIIDKIKICYEYNDRRMIKSLFNLIEGMMILNGQMCCKVNTTWCYMAGDHIRSIHINFRRFLYDHLITDGAILQKHWQPNTKEGEYNDLYFWDENFLVGDDSTYGNFELFDLLRFDPVTRHTYLYHVKRKLGGEIRTLAYQVQTSTEVIEKCFAGNAEVTANLHIYYQSIVQRYNDKGARISTYFDTFDKFVNLLSRRNKVSIILAICDPFNGNESFIEERDATDLFGKDTIRAAYDRLWSNEKFILNNYFDSFDSLFQSLIRHGYVIETHGSGNSGYLSSSKLLLAHRSQHRKGTTNYFSICEDNDRINGIVWRLVKPFSSLFESTSAKYCLNDMNNKGLNFKLCQIKQEETDRPNQQNRGTQFYYR